MLFCGANTTSPVIEPVPSTLYSNFNPGSSWPMAVGECKIYGEPIPIVTPPFTASEESRLASPNRFGAAGPCAQPGVLGLAASVCHPAGLNTDWLEVSR